MLTVYYEDKDIIVCEKPAGVNAQESADNHNMPALLKAERGIGVFPVHRLDIGTSGIMVYALNQKAAAALTRQIQQGDFIKAYAAVSHGCPSEREGIYEDLLYRDKQKNKSFIVNRERKGVKKAKLSYRILDVVSGEKESLAVWHIRLYTGRTHQIRAQLSSRKMPLLGDGKYGAKDNLPRIYLKSIYLRFYHPSTGEEMAFGEKEPIANRLFPDIYTSRRPLP